MLLTEELLLLLGAKESEVEFCKRNKLLGFDLGEVVKTNSEDNN